MKDVRTITVAAERPVAGGLTLGRHDGRVVLIAGAVPGELVRARIDRATKQVLFATVDQILEPSPFRRAVSADPACGGLSYAHIRYSHQLDLKSLVLADAFHRLGKIELEEAVPVMGSPEAAYRLRARFHIRERVAGFFREGTHQLCDAGPSQQVSAAALEAVRALIDWLGPVADLTEAVTMSENVAGSERAMHLELAADAGPVHEVPEPPPGTTGVTVETKKGLRVLAGQAHVHDGATDLGVASAGVPAATSWRRTAASFFQGNRYLTGHLLTHVLEQVTGPRVMDLYAGVGLFSVALAARGAEVVAVEGDAFSAADLIANAEPWGARMAVKIEAVEQAMAAVAAGDADVIVLDPPRAGVSPSALADVLRVQAPRIVYVSCDPATLARDSRTLVGGGYELVSLQAFDMFPNTPHIEAVGVFDRRAT